MLKRLNSTKYLLIIALSVLIVSCDNNVGNPQNKTNQSLEQMVENSLRQTLRIKGQPLKLYSLQERMKYYNVPGVSIAVINNGKIAWAKGYGVKELGSNNNVTTSTLFQAASSSKAIAALGSLLLVQNNQIDLDANVNDYITSWQVPENSFTTIEKVTLRRILSHSAGLTVSAFDGYPQGTPLPTITQILNGAKPYANSDPVIVESVPGSVWNYSGGGVTIEQLLVEEITKKPFADYMQDAILTPLEMSDSTYKQPLPTSKRSQAASGHIFDAKSRQVIRVVDGKFHNYPEMAAAGLWTTPTDLAKAIIAIQNKYHGKDSKLPLNTTTVQKMLTVQKAPSGLGPMVHEEAGVLIFDHPAGNEGFTAEWYGFVPLASNTSKNNTNNEAGVVIMVNADSITGGKDLITEILASVSDVYNWPQLRPVEKSLYPKPTYDLFVGNYQFKPGIVMNITKENQQVFMELLFNGLQFYRSTFFQDNDNTLFSLDGTILTFKIENNQTKEVSWLNQVFTKL